MSAVAKRLTNGAAGGTLGAPRDLARSVAQVLEDTLSAQRPPRLAAIAERLVFPIFDVPLRTRERCLLSALAQALELGRAPPPDVFFQDVALLFLQGCALASGEAT